jgi:hypothetical protein
MSRVPAAKLGPDGDRTGATDVDGDELAPLEEALGAERLDHLERKRGRARNGAAQHHAVVMRVGEPGAARFEQAVDKEIAAELGRAHTGCGHGIDSPSDVVHAFPLPLARIGGRRPARRRIPKRGAVGRSTHQLIEVGQSPAG